MLEVWEVLLTSGRHSSKQDLCAPFLDQMEWTPTLMSSVSDIFFCSSSLSQRHISVLSYFFAFKKMLIGIFFCVCVCITEDIFFLPSRDERNPMVYGVFTTTRWDAAYTVSMSIYHCFWSEYHSLTSIVKSWFKMILNIFYTLTWQLKTWLFV